MESSEVVKIRVENIYPHPDNPRKDLGDVTELAESMKKAWSHAEFDGYSGECIDSRPGRSAGC